MAGCFNSYSIADLVFIIAKERDQRKKDFISQTIMRIPRLVLVCRVFMSGRDEDERGSSAFHQKYTYFTSTVSAYNSNKTWYSLQKFLPLLLYCVKPQ